MSSNLFPIVPIVQVEFEKARELHLAITRYDNATVVLSVKQFCPQRKCVTAFDCCAMSEAELDEKMAEE
jgi:hypothetical protein